MAQLDIPLQHNETAVTAALRVLAGIAGWCVTHTTDGIHAKASLHYAGRAVDLADRAGAGADTSALQRINEQVLQLLPLSMISELIYAGPDAVCVHNGKIVEGMSVYGPAVMAEHHNHVHLGVIPSFTYTPGTPAPAPPKGVVIVAQYDPPIGPIAAVWQDETGKVIAAADPAGHVFAWGCKWYGNVAGKDYWGDRKVARIAARPDGAPGYRVVATDGGLYDLPDGRDKIT